MKKIAIYGKGGIGKSTTTSNISAALSNLDIKVCQIGCDPKNDSTRLLLGKFADYTVLDKLKDDNITENDIVFYGYNNIKCIESGGPEPGIGCAGRGIIVALEKIKELNICNNEDVILYDVLGDVVCGGFAVPIREDYADLVYIVSSGELMSLYAANNIAKGIKRFAGRNKVRLGGIIANLRNVPNEEMIVTEFAKMIGCKVIGFIPRNALVNIAENNKKTVVEYAPGSEQAKVYEQIAKYLINNDEGVIPKSLEFEDLENLLAKYSR